MKQIYTIFGMVAFWGLVAYGLFRLIIIIGELWHRYKFRFWLYQVFEYLKFRYRYQRTYHYKYFSEQAIKIHLAKFYGKVKGMEYRQRNLFKKQYVKMFNSLLAQIEKDKDNDNYAE